MGGRERPKIPSLEWRVAPPNPRYADVRPAVDTGDNLRRRLERLEEVRRYYRFRTDEIFRRVNVTALLTLMLEQAKLEMQVGAIYK